MFVLVEMVDTVRIPPWQFERKLNDSIAEELNKKLANKVVYNVGLCICLYDITKLEDAYVFPGDGASHTKAMRPSRCGFGNMRRKKEPMTCTWTPVRRSASGWWMRALLTRPRQAPVLPRLRPPVKRLPRKRPLTPSWDPSVNQAWGFSLGGLAVSASQKMLPVPAA
ncbi:DNA-directed RNA polymerase III subunit RPC8 isoform X3 [Vombatus ursinus]|uniref:DNA-directed RNA polymerase subunit n=1 Tax=Vombatus ursinus TaxID=29139 RepID=A0A4X2JRK7_VOMUR|nr:DNA-directed RNA polymerase III subunit RPC8 isoform X3 [Vombatus ursinus]